MILTCGITHTDRHVEAHIRMTREEQGFTCDSGCGRTLNLASVIDQMLTYRCVECGRWLCKPCIAAHFSETRHDAQRQRPDQEGE